MVLKLGPLHSEEQVVQILQELEGGKSVEEICREYNVARSTVYLWRKKYGGLDKPLLKKLKQLEKENARLKKIVAQQVLDLDSMKDLLGKDW
jgi:putative transposase